MREQLDIDKCATSSDSEAEGVEASTKVYKSAGLTSTVTVVPIAVGSSDSHRETAAGSEDGSDEEGVERVTKSFHRKQQHTPTEATGYKMSKTSLRVMAKTKLKIEGKRAHGCGGKGGKGKGGKGRGGEGGGNRKGGNSGKRKGQPRR